MKIVIDIPCVMNLSGNVRRSTLEDVTQFQQCIKNYINSDDGFKNIRTSDGHIIDPSYNMKIEAQYDNTKLL